MRGIIYAILVSVSTLLLKSQTTELPFEGKIDLIKETLSDTSQLSYTVKEKFVRVDEYNKNSIIIRSTIFDLRENSVIILHHAKKLYKKQKSEPLTIPYDRAFEIEKKDNYKIINNYKCFQWVVKSKQHNTTVSYWVANDNFTFFPDLWKLENKTEKTANYFLLIPDTRGYFPLECEERSFLREFRMKLAVKNIVKQNVNNSNFEIPTNYISFDK